MTARILPTFAVARAASRFRDGMHGSHIAVEVVAARSSEEASKRAMDQLEVNFPLSEGWGHHVSVVPATHVTIPI